SSDHRVLPPFPTRRSSDLEDFHYMPKPDAVAFVDGETFDLGRVSVRVIHAPGHTRGHCCIAIEPDGVLYLGDIDLTSFGPYYGEIGRAQSELQSPDHLVCR